MVLRCLAHKDVVRLKTQESTGRSQLANTDGSHDALLLLRVTCLPCRVADERDDHVDLSASAQRRPRLDGQWKALLLAKGPREQHPQRLSGRQTTQTELDVVEIDSQMMDGR